MRNKKKKLNIFLRMINKALALIFLFCSFSSLLKGKKRSAILYLILSGISFLAPELMENNSAITLLIFFQVVVTALLNASALLLYFSGKNYVNLEPAHATSVVEALGIKNINADLKAEKEAEGKRYEAHMDKIWREPKL